MFVRLEDFVTVGFLVTAFSLLRYQRRRRLLCRGKSSNPEQEYRLVEVQPCHYRSIVELALNTFGGHDWIQNDFHNWFLEGREYIILGLEARQGDPTLAALLLMRPNFQDQVGCLEALRVHPNHRGKGLGHFIQKKTIQVIKQRNDKLNLKRLRYTVYDENIPSIRIAIDSGFKEKYSFPYIMVADDENDNPESDDQVFLCRSGPGSILSFYNDCKAARNALCGEMSSTLTLLDQPTVIFDRLQQLSVGLLYQDWKPYDPTLANIIELKEKGQTAYQISGGKGGLSYGIIRGDGTGKICVLTHYWKQTKNDNNHSFSAACDFLIHVLHWLEIAQHESGVTSVYCCYPREAHEILASFHIPKKLCIPQCELILEMEL
jgi:GNAT superfamily N-acetyltransferase